MVEYRAAGIPRCVSGHGWRHTSPHGQQGEKGSARSCHSIYCSNIQYASKMFPEDTEDTRGTHHRATVPSLCVVHAVVAKVRLKFLSILPLHQPAVAKRYARSTKPTPRGVVPSAPCVRSLGTSVCRRPSPACHHLPCP